MTEYELFAHPSSLNVWGRDGMYGATYCTVFASVALEDGYAAVEEALRGAVTVIKMNRALAFKHAGLT